MIAKFKNQSSISKGFYLLLAQKTKCALLAIIVVFIMLTSTQNLYAADLGRNIPGSDVYQQNDSNETGGNADSLKQMGDGDKARKLLLEKQAGDKATELIFENQADKATELIFENQADIARKLLLKKQAGDEARKKAIQQAREEATKKAIQQAGDKATELTFENQTDIARKKAIQQAREEATKKAIQQAGDKATKLTLAKQADIARKKAIQQAREEATKKAIQQAGDKATKLTLENQADIARKKAIQQARDEATSLTLKRQTAEARRLVLKRQAAEARKLTLAKQANEATKKAIQREKDEARKLADEREALRQAEDKYRKTEYFYIGVAGIVGFLGEKNVIITPGIDRRKDTKYIVGGEILAGYSFDSGLRVETNLEFNTHKETIEDQSGIASGKVNTIKLMLNTYFDFSRNYTISPYIGLGAGVSFVASKINLNRGLAYNTDNKAISPTIMLGAGFHIRVAEEILFEIGYRHFRGTDLKFSSGQVRHDHALSQHVLKTGIKVIL